MNNFARLAVISLLSLSLFSCSQDNGESGLVSIEVPTPLVILVNREFVIGQGLELITITLDAPWSVVNFRSINNSTRIITVVGGAYIVTDPLSGTRKVLALETLNVGELSYEGVIFPSRDVNCDGVVDDTEAANGVGPNAPCTQLLVTDSQGNETFQDVTLLDTRQFYLADMASTGSGDPGTDVDDSVSQIYRGLSFTVEARIEGWFGTPERPESNFFREFFFETRAN